MLLDENTARVRSVLALQGECASFKSVRALSGLQLSARIDPRSVQCRPRPNSRQIELQSSPGVFSPGSQVRELRQLECKSTGFRLAVFVCRQAILLLCLSQQSSVLHGDGASGPRVSVQVKR